MKQEPIWQVSDAPPGSFAEAFPEYTPLERQLLWNRSIRDEQSIESFFNCSYEESIHDPWLFRSMQTVVDRIRRAINAGERILVFGDYDADGVCGASVLTEALRRCGADPDIYIPDRSSEGHGMSDAAVSYAVEREVGLIITVDCGVTDHKAIRSATAAGVDVIVTDHHHVPVEPLPALAMVNPNDPESGYPFAGLSGTGVAFKVAQALFREILDESDRESSEKWLLDRVAVATVADMMPLLGENRALVRFGLMVLAQSKRPGLRALMEVSRIEPWFDTKTLQTNITAETIGFRLGPRLNAASRMDHANTAFQLLATDHEEEAKRLADILDRHNRDRQRETERVLKEVMRRIDPDVSIVVEESDDWPIGLAGLIAGRVANVVWRPVVIIEKRNHISVGSARGIPGLDLIALFDECADLFESYGGHISAAGFTIKTDRIAELRRRLSREAQIMLDAVDTRPRMTIEMELTPDAASFETIEALRRFEPFGQQNPAPLFLFRRWKVADMRFVGSNGGHMKLWLTKEMEGGTIKGMDAIAFGRGGDNTFYIGSIVDCVGELQANEWNGEVNAQIMVADLRLAGSAEVEKGESALLQAYPVV